MTPTRRTFALAATAFTGTAMAGGLAAARAHPAPMAKPLIIGHRGASGERPEHTLMSYRQAIAEGADVIEPDLVMSKDGHFVVRHENEIGGATDVASHPEFASRKVTKVVDGQSITGWFTEDFTLAELKTLRARERLPALRPASAAFDGREPIVTYQEVVDLAKAESQRTGRTIGTYPEMKHPTYFAGLGMPMERRLADALKANGLDSPTAPVFVQCFEIGALKTFMGLSKAPRIQLVDSDGGPADRPAMRYADMVSASGLKAVAAYATGIGPDWTQVVPVSADALGTPTTLVADAHAAGLVVHPWTVRAENYFLPKTLWIGTSPTDHGDVGRVYQALFAAGVDGLFSDFPGLAAQARGAFRPPTA